MWCIYLTFEIDYDLLYFRLSWVKTLHVKGDLIFGLKKLVRQINIAVPELEVYADEWLEIESIDLYVVF